MNDTLFINITDISVDNRIYFIAIMVENFIGNDMTEYINIKNESKHYFILLVLHYFKCLGQPFNNITLHNICVSSSLILTSSLSLPSLTVTDIPLKTPSTGKCNMYCII